MSKTKKILAIVMFSVAVLLTVGLVVYRLYFANVGSTANIETVETVEVETEDAAKQENSDDETKVDSTDSASVDSSEKDSSTAEDSKHADEIKDEEEQVEGQAMTTAKKADESKNDWRLLDKYKTNEDDKAFLLLFSNVLYTNDAPDEILIYSDRQDQYTIYRNDKFVVETKKPIEEYVKEIELEGYRKIELTDENWYALPDGSLSN